MAAADPTDLLTVAEVVITEGRLGPSWSPDVTETEEHNSSCKPTRLPIESGSNVTDHVIQDPDRLVLTIVVSNDDPSFLALPNTPFTQSRDYDAYQKLKRWKRENTLLNISTSLDEYENMLLTELGAPRSSDNGDAMIASATFEPITTVKTRRSSYKVAKTATTNQATKPAAKVAPTPQTDNDGSILKMFSDSVGAAH